MRTRSEPMSAAPQTKRGAVVAAVERRMAQVSAGCRQVKRAPFALPRFRRGKRWSASAHRRTRAERWRRRGAQPLPTRMGGREGRPTSWRFEPCDSGRRRLPRVRPLCCVVITTSDRPDQRQQEGLIHFRSCPDLSRGGRILPLNVAGLQGARPGRQRLDLAGKKVARK